MKVSLELRNSQQGLENDKLQKDNERAAMTQTLEDLRTRLKEQM